MVGSVPLVDAALEDASGGTPGDALDDAPGGVACAEVDAAVCANADDANGTDKASASAVASGVLLNIKISSVEGPRSEIACDDGMVCVTKGSAAGWPPLQSTGGKRWAGVNC